VCVRARVCAHVCVREKERCVRTVCFNRYFREMRTKGPSTKIVVTVSDRIVSQRTRLDVNVYSMPFAYVVYGHIAYYDSVGNNYDNLCA